MGKAERVRLIEKIEAIRGSIVVAYITSTRPGLEVTMAMDSIRKIYDHLCLAGCEEKKDIDLFIMSNGGDGTVPWRLVTLIREFASKFSIIIPYRAFSAATLTALGADEIVMHPMGMLGPTDPTVTNLRKPSGSSILSMKMKCCWKNNSSLPLIW
jgi:ClpP class serine protease